MNPFAGYNYYQILELSRGAGPEEIAFAYQRMRQIYSPESLATYSLFTPEERAEILAQIEESYRVLSDAPSRRDYDAFLPSEVRPPSPAEAGPQPALPFDEIPDPSLGARSPSPVSTPESQPPAPEPPREITGESLRRFREALGINLDRMNELTRIRKGILQAIEDEDVGQLPAPVYLKGMVLTYARALNFSAPEVAAQQYLDHLASHKS
jgi:flagellar biosynthesis protein FlhG